jgi:hypothetical protein
MNNNELQKLVDILSILGTMYSVLKLQNTNKNTLETLDKALHEFQNLYNELSVKYAE